jgi:hypothetical protein
MWAALQLAGPATATATAMARARARAREAEGVAALRSPRVPQVVARRRAAVTARPAGRRASPRCGHRVSS